MLTKIGGVEVIGLADINVRGKVISVSHLVAERHHRAIDANMSDTNCLPVRSSP